MKPTTKILIASARRRKREVNSSGRMNTSAERSGLARALRSDRKSNGSKVARRQTIQTELTRRLKRAGSFSDQKHYALNRYVRAGQ